MIARTIENRVKDYLAGKSNKILFIWGPRRSGKTTILKDISQKTGARIFDFSLISDQELFSPDTQILEKIIEKEKIILIDEVQNYESSAKILKVLTDHFKVKVIATGSSELRQKGQNFETLAGRFEELYCLPLDIYEIQNNKNQPAYQHKKLFNSIAKEAQIYGNYPEVYLEKDPDKKIDLLKNLVETYVLKDIVNLYDLKNAKLARDVLLKIALQLGSEVSEREIAQNLQTSPQTVSNYIEIFIKNYILISLPSFGINTRRAVSKNRKLAFMDLGIRNALVSDFRPLELRPDRGGVWENFIISEAEKRKRNGNLKRNFYFYREYSGREVDLVVEDYQKRYLCLEMKSGDTKNVKKVFPLKHDLKVINPQNYGEVLKTV